MTSSKVNKIYSEIEKSIRKNLKKAIEAKAANIVYQLKDENQMPIVTGSLQESVGMSDTSDGFGKLEYTTYVGTSHKNFITQKPTAEYAIPVELKHHFFHKAVQNAITGTAGSSEDYWKQLSKAVDEGFESSLVREFTYAEAISQIPGKEESYEDYSNFNRKYDKIVSEYQKTVKAQIARNRETRAQVLKEFKRLKHIKNEWVRAEKYKRNSILNRVRTDNQHRKFSTLYLKGSVLQLQQAMKYSRVPETTAKLKTILSRLTYGRY